MPSSILIRRFWFIYFLIGASFIIIAYQIIQLTIIRQAALVEQAERQHHLSVDIPPLRGQIVDRDGRILATSLRVPYIYAVPRLMSDDQKVPLAKKLSEILSLSEEFVVERLSRDKAFIWLKRKVEPEEAEAIRHLKNPALGILEEHKRFYPQGERFTVGRLEEGLGRRVQLDRRC